jgi:hypothetical protein
MANPNRMVRSTGGAARNAIGKAYVKPKMAGTSAAGAGKRGIRDIAKGAAPKGPGKDGKYKPGDMFRSGRIVQPSVAPGKSKSKPKMNGAAAKAVAAGRAKAASRAKTNAAGRGKSASQDMNKRPVKALYKNK